MKLQFRHGVVSEDTFLNISGLNISFVPGTSPFVASFAYNRSDFLYSAKDSVINAWVLPNSTDTYYLYLEISLQNGSVSFGYITSEPVIGLQNVPNIPTDGLHVYDQDEAVFKVFDSSTGQYVRKLRMFIASYHPDTMMTSYASAMQSTVGLDQGPLHNVGAPLPTYLDGYNVRHNDGSIFTTERHYHIADVYGDTLRLDNKIFTMVSEKALPAYTIVRFSSDNKVRKAQYNDVGDGLLGITMEDTLPFETVDVLCQGIITNELWDWTSGKAGDPLWVSNGQLIFDDPSASLHPTRRTAPVAQALNKNSIIFDQGLGLTLHKHYAKQLSLNPTIDGYDNVQNFMNNLGSGGLLSKTLGGTMTGPLILSQDPVNANHAATLNYINNVALDDLDDVVITSPVVDDVLLFDVGLNHWRNGQLVASNDYAYKEVDVTLAIINDAIYYDPTIEGPTLKINIDSEVIDAYGGIPNPFPLNIKLLGLTEDLSYQFIIVVNFINGGENTPLYWATYHFCEDIRWRTGNPPSSPPQADSTLIMSFDYNTDDGMVNYYADVDYWTTFLNSDIPYSFFQTYADGVASGYWFSLASTDNTSPVVWGNPDFLALPPSMSANGVNIDVNVVDNGPIQSGVAVSGEHQIAAILQDGTLIGMNEDSTPYNESCTQVVAGQSHFLALRVDGSVIAFGTNFSGSADVPPSASSDVVKVFATGVVSYAIKIDGSVIGWGDNSHGQTTIPVEAVNVTDLAVAGLTTAALLSDNTVIAWGNNQTGQTNVPVGLTDVIKIYTTVSYSSASIVRSTFFAHKSDGSIVSWGDDSDGLVTATNGLTAVSKISGGGFGRAIILNLDGTVLTVGNITDNLGSPVLTTPGGITTATDVAIGLYGACALLADGSVITWGGSSTNDPYVTPSGIWNVSEIYMSPYLSDLVVARRLDGTIVEWILGIDYNLVGSIVPFMSLPTKITNEVLQLSASYSYGIVLNSDNTIYYFGSMDTLTEYNYQTNINLYVANSQGVSILPHAPASIHGYLVTTLGDLVPFGSNYYGQWNYPVPSITSPIIQITCGFEHNVALQQDGTLLIWGDNSSGQLDVPVGVQGNVVQVSAGEYHTVALLNDGTIVAWGDNSDNQLDVPIDLQGDAVMISSGAFHVMGLSNTGVPYIWGGDSDGQGILIPAALTSPALAVIAGAFCSNVVLCDGTLVQWGDIGPNPVPFPVGLKTTNTTVCNIFS